MTIKMHEIVLIYDQSKLSICALCHESKHADGKTHTQNPKSGFWSGTRNPGLGLNLKMGFKVSKMDNRSPQIMENLTFSDIDLAFQFQSVYSFGGMANKVKL